MTFLEAFEIVKNVLGETGTTISSENYDGIIVKRLEASNTLDEGKTGNQTHIAITGEQMDIFPYLKADGYFREDGGVSDPELKKYFVSRVPVVLFKNNCEYLSVNQSEFHFVEGRIRSFASVVRSKRASQADQIQMSMINLDGEAFVEFRKALHAGSYLILLKVARKFEYHIFGVKNSDADQLKPLNKKLYKLPTNTIIDVDDLVVVDDNFVQNKDHIYTIEELGAILKEMYNHAKESGQVAAIHMFGFKYGGCITKNNYPLSSIISKSGINNSYVAELNSGVNIFRSVNANEYGVRFFGQESYIEDIITHNVYGIQIKEETDALSEDNPHICIGWAKMGDLTNVKTKEDIYNLHTHTWPNNSSSERGQDVGRIYRFLLEAKKGDYVVYADGSCIHIGIISSDYYYDPNPINQFSDYVNNRSVKWIKKNVDYTALTTQFRAALGKPGVFFSLNDYKNEIGSLLSGETFIKNDDDEAQESLDAFSGFQPWLTSDKNPDYSGKEKYAGYAQSLKKIIEFMYGEGIISSNDLNDLSVEKYRTYLSAYESSEKAKEYDKSLSSYTGRAALKKYIRYIQYLNHHSFEYSDCIECGENLVVYGTPGCGKSFYVDHAILGKNDDGEYAGVYKKDNIIRTTFYLDYSNTDFVGQIVPVIEYEEDGRSTVTYRFVPGPFTIALECAFEHYNERVALVIEELNRGNAPCIFGDLFQLLDRIDEEGKDYPIGTSEYGILNTSLINYLKDNEHYNKKYKYSFDLDEIRIPANLSIYATMNTSDQNVFTLDTAFKRRWGFEKLSNKFDDSKKGKHPYKDYFVPGLQQVTWESFVNAINNYIVRDNDLLTSEDKQLGVYFVTKKMLIDPSKKDQYTKDELKKIIDKFAYKVFEYLWDDVAKFSRDKWFGNIKTLDELIKKYVNEEKVFADDIFQQ